MGQGHRHLVEPFDQGSAPQRLHHGRAHRRSGEQGGGSQVRHFGQVERVPGDPILGLLDAYRADPNPAKLDLGVGVYKDAEGITPIPQAVKLAEQRLIATELTKRSEEYTSELQSRE